MSPPSSPMTMVDRNLRRQLRLARRSLSAADQRRHAQRLVDWLGQHPLFLRARRIGAYVAADGEIDPGPLLFRAQAYRKQCHLPVLRPHPRRKLWFVPVHPGDPLAPNRFGIPEPSLRNGKIRLAWALDVLFLPLVGFDGQGNRLGMGGGYYDQTLAYLSPSSHWRRPLLIGLAHECQRLERLEARPWDVRLDLVVTEAGIFPAAAALPARPP